MSTSPNRGRRGPLTLACGTIPDGAVAVLATVPVWWARRAAEVGLHGACLDVEHAVAAPPPIEVSGTAPRTDLLDATPEQLGDAYVTALDPTARSHTGRHYTPPVLARALWEQTQATAGGPIDGLVFDPACGTGALLLPPLRSWLGACAELDRVAAVSSAVGGCDLDEAAVWLGNVALASVLLPWWAQLGPPRQQRRGRLPALLHVGDGLAPSGVRAAAVLMNPPYGRIRLDEHERLRWSHAVYGHANRYALFMAAGAAQLRPGGVLAALVPAGWLGGAYFQRLRTHLAADAPLDRVTYVRQRADVFSTGVLQETVLASFVRGAAPREVRCAALAGNGQLIRVCIGSARPPERPDLPWPLPREVSDVPLVRRAATLGARLPDYGWRVSTGPLVWNRAKERISAQRRAGSVAIVWAADLDGGTPKPARTRQPQRWIALGPGDDRALVLDRPAVLVQRTTAPEQPRRLLAAELDAGCLARWGGRVVVENHINVLTCLDPHSPLTTRLLMLLLRSAAFDRLYRCLTGSVAVSAYELSAMPLPDRDTLLDWARHDNAAVGQKIENYYTMAR
ncbi:MAG TPA: Eco57I restriction-modification methylase domain-containing protein [Pseudonocardiaceae bacterium]|nr:Eco57I restriction-modification methylase domain-containing protein [Pseudonocardiaceae bacterium]